MCKNYQAKETESNDIVGHIVHEIKRIGDTILLLPCSFAIKYVNFEHIPIDIVVFRRHDIRYCSVM